MTKTTNIYYRTATFAVNSIYKLGNMSTTKKKPWFMAVGFVRPHIPFNCPGKYWDINHDPYNDENSHSIMKKKQKLIKNFGHGASKAMQQMKTMSDNGFGEFRDFIPWELRDPLHFANSKTYHDFDFNHENDENDNELTSGGGNGQVMRRKRKKKEYSVEVLKSNTRRAYRSCISFMDFEFGRVLSALNKSGQRNNTIVAFISDHGYKLGEFDM